MLAIFIKVFDLLSHIKHFVPILTPHEIILVYTPTITKHVLNTLLIHVRKSSFHLAFHMTWGGGGSQ